MRTAARCNSSSTRQNNSSDWNRAVDREMASRTIFAQHAMHPDEVMTELRESTEALGNSDDVERFVRDATARLQQPLGEERGSPVVDVSDASHLPKAVREASGLSGRKRIGFHLPVRQDAESAPSLAFTPSWSPLPTIWLARRWRVRMTASRLDRPRFGVAGSGQDDDVVVASPSLPARYDSRD